MMLHSTALVGTRNDQAKCRTAGLPVRHEAAQAATTPAVASRMLMLRAAAA